MGDITKQNYWKEANNSLPTTEKTGLLRATDAVLEVKTPLNVIGKHIDEGRRYEAITKFSDIAGFDIGIAWSKRGWVQVLKKYE